MLHPIPNGDSGPSCFISASSHRHGLDTSCSASFHPWKSRHVTTGSCASTYVTPQPLWRGLIVIVIIVQLMLPPHCEGDWHRLLLSPTCVVTPPTQWTRLCGALTITLYCPQQQPVRTCWSPCLGMAARLWFQGLPLLALRCARFQGPRF
jgi:hypothetical protein